jgi:hypothetical protein
LVPGAGLVAFVAFVATLAAAGKVAVEIKGTETPGRLADRIRITATVANNPTAARTMMRLFILFQQERTL